MGMKKVVFGSLLALALQPLAYADSHDGAKATTIELPAAKRVDENNDIEKSMKKMGRNFKKLRKAKNLDAMKEPAQELAAYAGESQAIAEEMAQGMKKLRMGIVQLQAAIDKGDEAEAKAILEKLNEHRKKAHKYFGVGRD